MGKTYKKVYNTAIDGDKIDMNDLLKEKIIKCNTDELIFLCIGTDRSTGDSVGPWTGTKLREKIAKNKYYNNGVYVYGDLENPVHAKNLEDAISDIKANHPTALVIAIDACLGSMQSVGRVYIEDRSIEPGKAMNKGLPAVGNIAITGVVNISGALEFMVLQNTRLFVVNKIVDAITEICVKSVKYYSTTMDRKQKKLGTQKYVAVTE